jgi:alanine-synthesizing transaminase
MPSRLPADLSINATTRTLEALGRSGVTVVDLTQSNPTRVGLDYPADLLEPLASPQSLVYDPQPLGLPVAREAVSADFERRGIEMPPDRIAITASTSEAYALLFKLLCDADDAVLVPQPSYPLFEHLTVLESVRARPYRLEYHGRWRIDLDELEEAVDDRTRAVLVVSPNNPTGSFLHRDDLAALVELCGSRDLMLIGDEVFSDFKLDDAPYATTVSAAADIVTCTLGGLSKTAGLPQLKLGWIGFGGPANRLRTLIGTYEVIADAYLSVSTPVQTALPALLERSVSIRHQINVRIARNLRALRQFAARVPAVSVLTIEGGWSAVIQVPAVQAEERLVLELLTRDHVLVHPGYFFDFEREAYLVVSLLVEPSEFDRGVTRMLGRVSVPS